MPQEKSQHLVYPIYKSFEKPNSIRNFKNHHQTHCFKNG